MSDRPTTCDDHNDPGLGYLAWHAWAEKHSKKHHQVRCDECGLFKIWREGVGDE